MTTPSADMLVGGPSALSMAAVEAVRPMSNAQFRAIVDVHFAFIWRSLRGLGVSSSVADDAAQQVFWLAYQKRDSIVSGSERSFLFGLARGVAANRRRAHARSREIGDIDEVEARVDDSPNPEELSSMKQARTLLDQALDSMPDELRTVFVLFELEGLTMAEIAGVAHLAPGTVASRLRRAREAFHAIANRMQARTRIRGASR
jgi:RNA polymerase sigma-70 factor, ECF subfamily